MGTFTLGSWTRLRRFLEVGWLGHQLVGEGQANRLHLMDSGQSLFLRSVWFENIIAVEDGSRLSERMLGVNERHGARSAWWRVRSGPERIRRFLDIVCMVNPILHHLLQVWYYVCIGEDSITYDRSNA